MPKALGQRLLKRRSAWGLRVRAAACTALAGVLFPSATSAQSALRSSKTPPPWPVGRAFSVNDDTRLLIGIQVSTDPSSLLVAALKARPSGADDQAEIRLFRDTGSWISPPLNVDDAQAPKPIADGCGSTLVFWKESPSGPSGSQSQSRILFARLRGGRWSTPEAIPGIRNTEWARDHNPPVRLTGCRVALGVSFLNPELGGWSHRLAIVETNAVRVKHLVDNAVLPFSDLISQGNRLTFVYSAYAARGDPRHALKYVESTDEGKTWRLARVDTLAVGMVAQIVDMFLVGATVWVSRLEGKTFVNEGVRHLFVSPLHGTPLPTLTFTSGGIGTSHVMLGSSCTAPTLVRLDRLPRGYKRVTLHSYDGAEWRESEGPKDVFSFAAARSLPGRAAAAMIVTLDSTVRPFHYVFESMRGACAAL
jgi:hypothetical protein